MISYVKGPLMAIEEDVIVVEAGPGGLAMHIRELCTIYAQSSRREWGKR